MTCPSVEALERGGAGVEAHLAGCAICRSIAGLLAGNDVGDDDCARAELLIAAGAESPLAHDDARFLPAHLQRCPSCRETALDPGAGDEIGLQAVAPENYQIGTEIGRGGMGRVLSARDRRIGRAVALKEMLATDAVARARFEREARITARLQHPGIVSIYEVGRWPDGRPFYAMPILPGRTLRAAIRAAARPRERLALVPAVIAAADAVAYAHSQRIIHRDLSPTNVLLGSYGETIVIDWGVAKELDDDEAAAASAAEPVGSAGLTVVGAVVGTPAYIAPEQADAGPVDERADVYALGAILFEVLSGQPPYAGASGQSVIEALRARRPPPLPWAGSGVPRDLVSVVTTAMALDPAARYPSAGEFAADLRRQRNGERVQAHRYTRRELGLRWLSRRVSLLAAAAVLLGLVAVTAIVAGVRVLAERRRAEATTTLLLGERGRQELLAGQPARALAYLDEAYRRGDRSPAVRFLLAAAARGVEAGAPQFQGPRTPRGLAFSPDGARIAVASGAEVALFDLPAAGPRLALAVAAPVGILRDGSAPARVTFLRDGVHLVAWSPDGREIALWDVAQGTRVRGWRARGKLRAVELSRDEALLFAASDGGPALYEVATGAERPIEARAPVAAFAATGARVLVAEGGVVIALDARSGDERARWETDTGAIAAIAPSPTAAEAVLVGADGSAAIWQTGTGERRAILAGARELRAAQFSPDGRRILVEARDRRRQLYDGAGVLVQDLGVATAAAFAPDGARVATIEGDLRVRLWRARTGTLLDVFEAHEPADLNDSIALIAFSPDGTRLVGVTEAGFITSWDLGKSALLGARAVAGSARAAGIGPAGPVRAVADDAPAIWLERDARDPTRIEIRRERGAPTVVTAGEIPALAALSPDGSRLLTAAASGPSELWDAASGRRLAELAPRARVASHAFSADGARLVVHHAGAQHADLWDARAGQRVAELHGADPIVPGADRPRPGRDSYIATFSPDGRVVAATTVGLRVWRASDGQPLYRNALVPSDAASAYARAVRFAPDSATLALASARGWSVLRVADGARLATLEHLGSSEAVFAPSGDLLVTVGTDLAQVWDWRGGRVLARFPVEVDVGTTGLPTFAGAVPVLARFQRGGDRLAIATAADGVQLWDTRLETRSPDEVARVAERHLVPWKLLKVQGGELVPAWTRASEDWRGTGPALANPDFEAGAPGAAPPGWMSAGDSSGFRARTSAERPFGGSRCAVIEGSPIGASFGHVIQSMRTGRPRGTGFGYLMQSLDAGPYRGRKVRLRAAVRNEGPQPTVLFMRVDRRNGEVGFFDNMADRPIERGEWRVHEIVGEIEPDAKVLNLGLVLTTAGRIWLDEVSLEVL